MKSRERLGSYLVFFESIDEISDSLNTDFVVREIQGG
jgi:hypothetical protein